MNEYFETRIKTVFPTSKKWEPDVTQFDINNYTERIESVIAACIKTLPVHATCTDCWNQYQAFAFTSQNAPEFGAWLSMSNSDKIHWIQVNNTPFVVLWVKVSRVADYYITFFNHWKPRENTGYLDADCDQIPSNEWQVYSTTIFDIFNKNGFSLADAQLLNERVPFVFAWGGDEIPNDDPRWEDDNFEPDPIQATVYDCLFGDQ